MSDIFNPNRHLPHPPTSERCSDFQKSSVIVDHPLGESVLSLAAVKWEVHALSTYYLVHASLDLCIFYFHPVFFFCLGYFGHGWSGGIQVSTDCFLHLNAQINGVCGTGCRGATTVISDFTNAHLHTQSSVKHANTCPHLSEKNFIERRCWRTKKIDRREKKR